MPRCRKCAQPLLQVDDYAWICAPCQVNVYVDPE